MRGAAESSAGWRRSDVAGKLAVSGATTTWPILFVKAQLRQPGYVGAQTSDGTSACHSVRQGKHRVATTCCCCGVVGRTGPASAAEQRAGQATHYAEPVVAAEAGRRLFFSAGQSWQSAWSGTSAGGVARPCCCVVQRARNACETFALCEPFTHSGSLLPDNHLLLPHTTMSMASTFSSWYARPGRALLAAMQIVQVCTSATIRVLARLSSTQARPSTAPLLSQVVNDKRDEGAPAIAFCRSQPAPIRCRVDQLHAPSIDLFPVRS